MVNWWDHGSLPKKMYVCIFIVKYTLTSPIDKMTGGQVYAWLRWKGNLNVQTILISLPCLFSQFQLNVIACIIFQFIIRWLSGLSPGTAQLARSDQAQVQHEAELELFTHIWCSTVKVSTWYNWCCSRPFSVGKMCLIC